MNIHHIKGKYTFHKLRHINNKINIYIDKSCDCNPICYLIKYFYNLIFLNPEFTFWALFHFSTNCKFDKFSVLDIIALNNFIFFASLFFMVFYSAIKAIVFSTFWAGEIFFSLINKCVSTISSWTIRNLKKL